MIQVMSRRKLMPSPEQIHKMLANKKNEPEYQERNEAYRKLQYAYHGQYEKLKKVQEGESLGLDLDQSVVESHEDIVCNILNTIVDGNVTKLGILPEIEVIRPYPSTKEKDEAVEKVERIIYGYWYNSKMVRVQATTGFDGSCLGMAVYGVYPDFEMKYPIIKARDPATAYFEKEYGKDYDDLEWVIYEYDELGSVINKKFGVTVRSTKIKAIEYIDKQWRILFIADGGTRKTLASVRHGYGFVPSVPVPNLIVPRRAHGSSDIEQAVGMNQYLIHLFNLERYGIEEVLFSPIILIGPQKAPEELEMGPDAVWGVELGGGAMRLPPVQTTPDMHIQMNRSIDYIRMNTGFGQAEFGETPVTSVGTGKFQSSLRGPMGERIEFKRGIWGEAMSRVNEMCLKIDEKEWPNEKKTVIGKVNATKFALEYTPKEDINGWYYNEVFWSPFGADMPTRMAVLQSLRQDEIVSKKYVRKNIRDIRDPNEMEREIQQEREDELKHAARLAQIQTGEMPQEELAAISQGPGLGQQSPPISPAAEEGGPAPVPPPPLPVGPEQMGAPGIPPEAVAGPVEQKYNVQDVLGLLGRIRKGNGRIFLIGELVEAGTSDTIEIALTDGKDKKLILDAVPELYGDIKFTVIKGEPSGEFVEVTPETGGAE
jgi:hypothetical protein